jgi:peptidoglycan/xylan/chitin deacetylase (PgdA/CDA1 family)
MSLTSFRLDRFATLYLAQPFLASGSRSKTNYLPILMYHSISETPEEDISPYYRTVTRPEVFRSQMSSLREAGWRGVTLRDGLSALPRLGEGIKKIVAITFDDGFEDFYTTAYPALQKYGFSATMYLPTGFISESPKTFKDHRCMSWQQVRELHANGIEFGSHTVNHPKLWDLDWPEITRELGDSRSAIEDQLRAAVPSFAYPYAFPQQDRAFTARFREELRKAGYQNCVTTAIGRVDPEDDLYTLKRLPANSCDDSVLLQAKLAGAYDWLALAQMLMKRVKAFV